MSEEDGHKRKEYVKEHLKENRKNQSNSMLNKIK